MVCYYHLIGQFLTILSPDWSVDVSQTERLMLKVMLSSLIRSETVTNPLSSELRRWLLCLQKTPCKYELPCTMYTIRVYGSWIWTLGTSLWGGNSSWNILNKVEPVKLWVVKMKYCKSYLRSLHTLNDASQVEKTLLRHVQLLITLYESEWFWNNGSVEGDLKKQWLLAAAHLSTVIENCDLLQFAIQHGSLQKSTN